eukprot:jgi/Psemu1/312313/fgenesh1_kg.919_\
MNPFVWASNIFVSPVFRSTRLRCVFGWIPTHVELYGTDLHSTVLHRTAPHCVVAYRIVFR